MIENFFNSDKFDKMKKRVPISQKPILIKYKDEVFKIKRDELRNIALDYYKEIEKLGSKLYGEESVGDLHRNCLTCPYNNNNLYLNLISHTLMNVPPKVICSFSEKEDLEVADFFYNINDNISFYAKDTSCFMDDIIIRYLADNNILSKYKTETIFDFPSIKEFENGNLDYREFSKEKYSVLERILGELKI